MFDFVQLFAMNIFIKNPYIFNIQLWYNIQLSL